MARLHLVTAHRSLDRSDAPVVLYCGQDADAAQRARDSALASGEFALADKHHLVERHTRYADPQVRAAFLRKASAPAAPAQPDPTAPPETEPAAPLETEPAPPEPAAPRRGRR